MCGVTELNAPCPLPSQNISFDEIYRTYFNLSSVRTIIISFLHYRYPFSKLRPLFFCQLVYNHDYLLLYKHTYSNACIMIDIIPQRTSRITIWLKSMGTLYNRDYDLGAVFISSPELCADLFGGGERYPQLFIPPAWSHHSQVCGRKRGLMFLKGEEWWQVIHNTENMSTVSRQPRDPCR